MWKSALSLVMAILVMLYSIAAFAAGEWYDLGRGWRMRVDGPHPGAGKWHVHVYDGKEEVGSEGLDGSESHGDKLTKVPDSIKKEVRAHPGYKKGQKKQEDLEKAKREIEAKNLDMGKTADVAIAIAIVVACTATFFFPADDIPAWANFLRAVLAK